jgi:peroxiredoxin
VVCLALLAPQAARAQRAEVGLPAPDFRLALLQGGEATLSQYRGRPVVINFWASWCAPCRTEIPDILAAWAAHRAAGLEVLAVNLTDQEIRRQIQPFVTEMQMTFPILMDERGRVRGSYRLRGVPTTVFVDTAGVVRFINPGPLTSESLTRGLQLILPVR